MVSWGIEAKDKKKKKELKKKIDQSNGNHSGSEVTDFHNSIFFYSSVDREANLELNKLLYEKSMLLRKQAIQYDMAPPPIKLHINSFGGGIFAGISTMDTIQNIQNNHGVEIHSIIEGGAASAATLISVCCSKKIIRPTSYMLIHQLSSISWGKYEELKDDMKNNDKLMDMIYSTYEKYTKLKREKLQEILKHDLWFDADECLEHGLVDEILV